MPRDIMELPLFPLRVIVLPGGVLPLRIFEPRYLDMVSRCLRSDSGFGVCLIHEGQEVGQAPVVYLLGTLCKIVDWGTLPDGLLGITVRGERKFRVIDTQVQPDRLLIGQVELLAEEGEQPLPEAFADMALLLSRLLEDLGPPYSEMPAFYQQAGFVSSRLSELLPVEVEQKYQLLALDDPLARLEILRDVLNRLQEQE